MSVWFRKILKEKEKPKAKFVILLSAFVMFVNQTVMKMLDESNSIFLLLEM